MELKFATLEIKVNARECRRLAEALNDFASSIEGDDKTSWYKNILLHDHAAGIQLIYEPKLDERGVLLNKEFGFTNCSCRVPEELKDQSDLTP